jgi:hypothetical protein
MRPAEGCDGCSSQPVRTTLAGSSNAQDAGLRTWKCGLNSCTGRHPRFVQWTGHRFPKPGMAVRLSQRGPHGRRERQDARPRSKRSVRGSSPRSATIPAGRSGPRAALYSLAPDRRLEMRQHQAPGAFGEERTSRESSALLPRRGLRPREFESLPLHQSITGGLSLTGKAAGPNPGERASA